MTPITFTLRDKKRLPRERRRILFFSERPMNNKETTSRKKFMQRAGLAVAGMFTLAGFLKSADKGSGSLARSEPKTDPFRRIRVAQGAVQRKV
jgi:hypothetical protein